MYKHVFYLFDNQSLLIIVRSNDSYRHSLINANGLCDRQDQIRYKLRLAVVRKLVILLFRIVIEDHVGSDRHVAIDVRRARQNVVIIIGVGPLQNVSYHSVLGCQGDYRVCGRRFETGLDPCEERVVQT